MDPTWSMIGLSAAAGMLTSLSPCVLPLLPLIIGGSLQNNRWTPAFMAMGMSLSFALLGAFASSATGLLNMESEGIRHAGGWILMALSLAILVPALRERFSGWALPLANRANSISSRLDPRSPMQAMLLGGTLGLVWTPCSGPFLATALALASAHESALKGGLLLWIYGLGAAAPLLLVGYASRKAASGLNFWTVKSSRLLQNVFGWVIGMIGLGILTGLDKALEAAILMRLPETWISASISL